MITEIVRASARAACVLLLAAFCLVSVAGESANPAPSDAPTPPLEFAKLWNHVLDETDPNSIYATFEVIAKLRGDDWQVDAQQCRDNTQQIDDALVANPVGLAMWYVAYQCARATQQDALAEQRLAMF